MEIGINITSDEDDFFDRQCPKPSCLKTFKIHNKDRGFDASESVTCPYCKTTAPGNNWFTLDMARFIEDTAHYHAQALVENELRSMSRSMGRSSSRNGFGFSVSVEVTGAAPMRPMPHRILPKMSNRVTCHGCGALYEHDGSGSVCPCCGTDEKPVSEAA